MVDSVAQIRSENDGTDQPLFMSTDNRSQGLTSVNTAAARFVDSAQNLPGGSSPVDGGSLLDDSGQQDGLDWTSAVNHHEGLRPIVIDGSNIAMSHGNKEYFSCRGIKIVVDWFRLRGHRDITAFVPLWRRETHKQEYPVVDLDLLLELEREKVVVFTPSRMVSGKRIICHDDRYIVKLALDNGGVIVSNDNYRDLAAECPEFRKVIEERLLMYSFVNDRFMPPDDPLGRRGPSLDDFLRFESLSTDPLPTPCPYDKRCTFGVRCKFFHSDRPTRRRRGSHSSNDAADHASPGRGRRLPINRPCGPRRSYDCPQSADNPHDGLRLVRSEPATTSDHESDQLTCGHLELAMMLSDEYKRTGQKSNGGEEQELTLNVVDATENNHRQLRRQLTIQDQTDPRLARMLKAMNQKTKKTAAPSGARTDSPITFIAAAADTNGASQGHIQQVSIAPDISNSTTATPARSSSADILETSVHRRVLDEFETSSVPEQRAPWSGMGHLAGSTGSIAGYPFSDSQQLWGLLQTQSSPVIFREPPPPCRQYSSPIPAGMFPPCFVPASNVGGFVYTAVPPQSQLAAASLSSYHGSGQYAHMLGCGQATYSVPGQNCAYVPVAGMPHVGSCYSSVRGEPPREETFRRLCSIFPADKVHFVMAQHPDKTDPENLCKLLCNMSFT
jgi:hypothetical protein